MVAGTLFAPEGAALLRRILRRSALAGAVLPALLATPALARRADCLFELNGQKLIDGPCQFLARRGGSFKIVTLKGAGIDILAEVDRIGSREAMGAWNGREGVPRAREPLGVLWPAGACWRNARARVCAWRWGEKRYFVDAPPPSPPPPAPAAAGGAPVKVGDCVQTEISAIGSRLEGMPDSGSAVSYADGVVGVSYDVVAAIRDSRVGDPVTLCLVSVPQDCPKGDDRGKVYSATNLRTHQGWSLSDSEHMCGGA